MWRKDCLRLVAPVHGRKGRDVMKLSSRVNTHFLVRCDCAPNHIQKLKCMRPCLLSRTQLPMCVTVQSPIRQVILTNMCAVADATLDVFIVLCFTQLCLASFPSVGLLFHFVIGSSLRLIFIGRGSTSSLVNGSIASARLKRVKNRQSPKGTALVKEH